MPFDEVAKLFAFFDRLDLGRRQRTTDDQAHMAAVADQSLYASRCKRERAGIEIPGQPVVALGGLECRDVEQRDKVTVIGGVFELPLMIAEHGQLSSSCQSLSCVGSSISSR